MNIFTGSNKVEAMKERKTRDPYFDNVKILLMLLVILGHVLPINQVERCNLATYYWVYSFHMPLFVFISGYFTIIKKERFWFGILKLFETFVVISLISIGYDVIVGKGASLRSLIVPQWTLWYLVSLIWWRIILYILPEKCHQHHVFLIVFSLIVSLAGGFIHIGTELSVQRTFAFMPFFMLGYVTRQRGYIGHLQFNRYMCIVFLIIVWVFYFIFDLHDKHFLYNKAYYASHYADLTGLMLRMVYIVLASFLSISFLSAVPHKRYRWTHLGALTLFIYIWHRFILTFLYYLNDKLGLPSSLPFCLFYTFATLAIIYLMSKIHFFHWLLNPITSLFPYKKGKTT